MPREINGEDGIVWSCVEAYAGLSGGGDNAAAERAAEGDGMVAVVCTPGGGAKTARLELPKDWEQSLGDEELLRAIEANRET
ncbi:MAG TPA: hypothetical protein VIP46_19485 [Pyrinomonadaceae bacterium]